ncbi:MAG: hypothetical protein Hyperionvirus1_118 [Hyperionvirus sp.]|uniref:Uncharacterized protein n=1 Tax=Hyperionvirus sp. TaxID=2487770 RepID=A0A3G5AB54_9VIRU|nr:MAG: hypothetical protein Hyperionvirus1_118 [Hyperionvirus sp.]
MGGKCYIELLKMKIGCDIGGVLKEMISDEPIVDALETIRKLVELKHQIILISKCKEGYRTYIQEWLKEHKLDNLEVYYCDEYGEKIDIGMKEKIDVMIDDKIQVLNSFERNRDIKKIWFCCDSKKINGAKKYQSELLKNIFIAGDWKIVFEIICIKN